MGLEMGHILVDDETMLEFLGDSIHDVLPAPMVRSTERRISEIADVGNRAKCATIPMSFPKDLLFELVHDHLAMVLYLTQHLGLAGHFSSIGVGDILGYQGFPDGS